MMINKYSLSCIVLLLAQGAYPIHDLRELEKKSLKSHKEIFEEKRFRRIVNENCPRVNTTQLSKLLAMRFGDLPNFRINTEIKSFKNFPGQVLTIYVDPSTSTFLAYRNDGEQYDDRLLKTVREQWERGLSLKKVNVTVCDNWATASFPIMINACNVSLDTVKARVATMVQWCGQFRYPIPTDCILLKNLRADIFYNITHDDQLKEQKHKSLCALIDMSDFKQPAEKGE